MKRFDRNKFQGGCRAVAWVVSHPPFEKQSIKHLIDCEYYGSGPDSLGRYLIVTSTLWHC